MKYWDDPKAFQDRNTKILKDKLEGASVLDLSIKYHLSATRIFAIIKRQKDSKKFRKIK
jgi:Mor family transcriptional regulator